MPNVRCRVLITAAAIAAAVTAPAVAAGTAAAAPARPAVTNLLAFGQPCQDNSAGLWYCINNTLDREVPGNRVQMWQAGQAENNWQFFRVGYVSEDNQWPFGPNDVWNYTDNGESVGIIQYVGSGAHASDFCASQQSFDNSTHIGPVALATCTQTANDNRDQYVQQGSTYQSVWASEQQSGAWLGTTGLINREGVFSCGDVCYVHWTWIGQGKTFP